MVYLLPYSHNIILRGFVVRTKNASWKIRESPSEGVRNVSRGPKASNFHLSASSIKATQGGNVITFSDGKTIGATMKSFVGDGRNSAIDSLQIKLGDTTTAIDKMWLLEWYVLA